MLTRAQEALFATWVREYDPAEVEPRIVLRERRDQMAGTLSGGEQQILAIARALVSGYLDDIRAAAPADPEHPVLAPGDRAQKARTQSLAKGMFIDDGLWADLQNLAADSQKEKKA